MESFVSHVEPTMWNLMWKPLSCMCCLETDSSFIYLQKCSHCDFLDSFEKPKIDPCRQVVCQLCHEMLKKIKLFKLQTERNFKLLSKELCNKNTQIKAEKQRLSYTRTLQFDLREENKGILTHNDLKTIANKHTTNKNSTFKVNNISNEKIQEIDSEIMIPEHRIKVPISNLSFQSVIDSIIFNSLNKEKEINNTKQDHNISNNEGTYHSEDSEITTENSNSMVFENQNIDSVPIKTENMEPVLKEQIKVSNVEKAFRIINQNSNCNGVNLLVNSIQSIAGSIPYTKVDSLDLTSNDDVLVLPKSEISNNSTNISCTISKEDDIHTVLNEPGTSSDDNILLKEEEELEEELVTEMEIEEEKIQPIPENNAVSYSGSKVPPKCVGKIEQVTLTRMEVGQERTKMGLSAEFLSKPHRCNSCFIGFEYEENLIDHMQRKHDKTLENSATCEICNQNVLTSSYPEHKSTHFIRYKCLNCDKLFPSLADAKRHYKKDHGDKKTIVYTRHRRSIINCKKCKMAFVRLRSLNMHMKSCLKR